jgi:hypothetical protein
MVVESNTTLTLFGPFLCPFPLPWPFHLCIRWYNFCEGKPACPAYSNHEKLNGLAQFLADRQADSALLSIFPV